MKITYRQKAGIRRSKIVKTKKDVMKVVGVMSATYQSIVGKDVLIPIIYCTLPKYIYIQKYIYNRSK